MDSMILLETVMQIEDRLDLPDRLEPMEDMDVDEIIRQAVEMKPELAE